MQANHHHELLRASPTSLHFEWEGLLATELALVPTSFFRELGMALYKIDRIIAL